MLSANGEICLKEGAGFFHLNKGDALNFSEKKIKMYCIICDHLVIHFF